MEVKKDGLQVAEFRVIGGGLCPLYKKEDKEDKKQVAKNREVGWSQEIGAQSLGLWWPLARILAT